MLSLIDENVITRSLQKPNPVHPLGVFTNSESNHPYRIQIWSVMRIVFIEYKYD